MFNSWDEGLDQRRCFQHGYTVCPLIWWKSGINVNLDRHHSLFTNHLCLIHWRVTRVMCKWPLTFALYLALRVSVSVCLWHECGERCDLTAEWCAAWCEDWEPINTLPFFTPHIGFMLIVVCDCLSVIGGGVYCIMVVSWLYYMVHHYLNTVVPACFKLLCEMLQSRGDD